MEYVSDLDSDLESNSSESEDSDLYLPQGLESSSSSDSTYSSDDSLSILDGTSGSESNEPGSVYYGHEGEGSQKQDSNSINEAGKEGEKLEEKWESEEKRQKGQERQKGEEKEKEEEEEEVKEEEDKEEEMSPGKSVSRKGRDRRYRPYLMPYKRVKSVRERFIKSEDRIIFQTIFFWSINYYFVNEITSYQLSVFTQWYNLCFTSGSAEMIGTVSTQQDVESEWRCVLENMHYFQLMESAKRKRDIDNKITNFQIERIKLHKVTFESGSCMFCKIFGRICQLEQLNSFVNNRLAAC
jgi:hypothetical protein